MSGADYLALLPLLALAGGAIIGLLVLAATRRPAPVFAVALGALAASFVSAIATWGTATRVAGLLSFEPFVLFTLALLDGATLFVALSSWGYFRGRGEQHGGEYYLFLLLATLGGGVLASAAAFATLFVGLELLSVALFPLIAWRRDVPQASEASIKYLILSGASSAFLLFGMAMVYAATGTMSFGALAAGGLLAPAGFAVMVVGVGFKLAVVPFHFWTPDIYDGASAPAAGYVATVSKGAMMVLLARLYVPAVLGRPTVSLWIFGVLAAATMFVGNLLALRERNVKRILAYSSIAHLGYLMFAFMAGGGQAVRAISFYLLAYFAMTLGAFAVIAELSVGRERDFDNLEDYRGLAASRPWLAGILVVMLVSLTGLPLTAGFVGKFVILTAGEGALLWVLAVILAVNTTISLFYYFKVVSAMFRPAGVAEAGGAAAAPAAGAAAVAAIPAAARVPAPAVGVAAALGLALLTVLVVVLGIYPTPVLELIARFALGG